MSSALGIIIKFYESYIGEISDGPLVSDWTKAYYVVERFA